MRLEFQTSHSRTVRKRVTARAQIQPFEFAAGVLAAVVAALLIAATLVSPSEARRRSTPESAQLVVDANTSSLQS
jgi:hypothetical protein